MGKKTNPSLEAAAKFSQQKIATDKDPWHPLTLPIAKRFNLEYEGKAFEVGEEVESMAIFQDWASGKLQNRIASPFWKLLIPKKNQCWLDLGCGISFLIYPWRDWNALFYGQDISAVAQEILRTRAPQLNSKLFKGVQLGGAHRLPYADHFFEGVVATGWSCYYTLDYWEQVLQEVRRVLKPGGSFLVDIMNPERDLAEDWAILETYFGAEVHLTPEEDWFKLIRDQGGKRIKAVPGHLFDMMLIRFPEA